MTLLDSQSGVQHDGISKNRARLYAGQGKDPLDFEIWLHNSSTKVKANGDLKKPGWLIAEGMTVYPENDHQSARLEMQRTATIDASAATPLIILTNAVDGSLDIRRSNYKKIGYHYSEFPRRQRDEETNGMEVALMTFSPYGDVSVGVNEDNIRGVGRDSNARFHIRGPHLAAQLNRFKIMNEIKMEFSGNTGRFARESVALLQNGDENATISLLKPGDIIDITFPNGLSESRVVHEILGIGHYMIDSPFSHDTNTSLDLKIFNPLTSFDTQSFDQLPLLANQSDGSARPPMSILPNRGIGISHPGSSNLEEKLVVDSGDMNLEQVSLLFRSGNGGQSPTRKDAMRLRSGWHYTRHDTFGKQRMSIEGALGTSEGISAWNEIVAFRADGNVGIGVHDPSETLHVIGNTYMEGKLFMSHPTDRFKSNTNLNKRSSISYP